MLSKFRQLFQPQGPRVLPAIPSGERVYAVGDIHGRLDLFTALIAAVDADDAAQEPAETTVILLGDLVDRGPDSAGVIAAARAWQARRKVRIITGNHEEMFLGSFAKLDVLRHFLRHGGRETILSYGVDTDEYTRATLEEVQEIMNRNVPSADRDYLNTFEDSILIGDYAFVHAGIDPKTALDEQRPSDLRWIREPFLSHKGDYGKCVVHGHTIAEQVEWRINRIGIDTGAYMYGTLTALCLQDTQRWLIEACDGSGAIVTQSRITA